MSMQELGKWGACSWGGAATQALSTNTFYCDPVTMTDAPHGIGMLQIVWASGSTPAGTATMEVSNDGSTWTDSGLTGITVTGTSGSGIFPIAQACARLYRLKVVISSGTATGSGTWFKR